MREWKWWKIDLLKMEMVEKSNLFKNPQTKLIFLKWKWWKKIIFFFFIYFYYKATEKKMTNN